MNARLSLSPTIGCERRGARMGSIKLAQLITFLTWFICDLFQMALNVIWFRLCSRSSWCRCRRGRRRRCRSSSCDIYLNWELKRNDTWNETVRDPVKNAKRGGVMCGGIFGFRNERTTVGTLDVRRKKENLFGISRMRYLCASTMIAIGIFQRQKKKQKYK